MTLLFLTVVLHGAIIISYLFTIYINIHSCVSYEGHVSWFKKIVYLPMYGTYCVCNSTSIKYEGLCTPDILCTSPPYTGVQPGVQNLM